MSLRDRDAVEVAHAAVRAMIVSGRAEPGAELSQVQLARALGVSTTPLREALRRLEAEGLVEARRNRRPRVARLDPEDLDAVYAERVLLESLGVALSVPRMTAADLDALERHLDAMRASAAPRAFNEAHAAFHTGLVERCDAPLKAEIHRLMARGDRYRRMSVFGDDPAGRRAGDREHGEILAACRLGDGREASRCLAAHLARSALTLLAQLAPDAQPVAVRAALRMLSAAPRAPVPG
ncbi:MAG TPA: GntR family transcriptional regulator [Solirubrobacteraceae bacterium]|jgi:DNA-binding GntR family transcriptional regulator